MKKFLFFIALTGILITAGCSDTAQEDAFDKEAGEYLDALIQATVYQDVEAYIEKDPSSESEDEKLEAGELHKDFFRQMYYDNTQLNVEGYNIPDDAIEDLTDAFMKAILLTEYEILDTNPLSDDEDNEFVVTISVNGIDDQKVYAETEEKLIQVIDDEKIDSDEDVVTKNLEILTQGYNELEDVLESVEIDVNVTKNEDGEYMVLLQDQYLAGFVQ